MKSIILKLVTLSLAVLAGLGTMLASKGLISAADVPEINQVGGQLAAAIAAIVAGILAPILENLRNKFFPSHGNDSTEDSGGKSLLLLLACTAAVLMTGLTSCGLNSLTGSISYRDPDSGAKGGLVLGADGSVTGTVRVTTYDEHGNAVGSADLSVPIGTVDLKSGK